MVGAPWPLAAAASDHLLVAEVYYDTYVSGESDEFVRLHNPTTAWVSLAGWTLTDGEGVLTFPAGAGLDPGAFAYVTGRATSFRLDMVQDPQWEYLSDSDPSVPQLVRTGSFSLANSGDEVLLRDPSGTVIDAVVYGASAYAGPGWTGAPIPDVGEGVILERDRSASRELVDTNAASDWDDARVYYAGQSHVVSSSFTFSGSVTTFTSPDSSFASIVSELASATTSIDLAIYEMTSPALGDALLARALDGVAIRILIEGGPVGFGQTERYQENWILDRLVQAGADVRFMITNSSVGVHDRYNFVHAKYALLDGARTLAMSGNWKSTGVPTDPTTGNREWGIVVDHAPLAGYLKKVFDDDFDASHRDVLPFNTGTDWRYLAPPAGFIPDRSVPTGDYEHPYPSQTFSGAFTVTPILAPDTVLEEHGGLLDALRGAQSSILIEQMYAHKHWGSQSATPATAPNLLLEAALDAARNNGAHVYVLLGDEYIDEEDTRNAFETRDYINNLRLSEGIPVYSRIVDHRIANITKIHNKGVVIDGKAALVSSINWGRASPTFNRELALLVENVEVAAFYEDVFWYDWSPKDRVAPGDLAVVSVDYAQAELAPGVLNPLEGVVRVGVANVGAFDISRAFSVRVTATPSWVGEPVALTPVAVASVSAGAIVSVDVAFPMVGRLGDWTFDAVVDAEDVVFELSEDNNALSGMAPVLVPTPGIDALWLATNPSGVPQGPP